MSCLEGMFLAPRKAQFSQPFSNSSVISGMETVKAVEALGSPTGETDKRIVIEDCGDF